MAHYTCLKPIRGGRRSRGSRRILGEIRSCLWAFPFVKESLTFSVSLPPRTSHRTSEKADFIIMLQNFNLLLWGNRETWQHGHWPSCALKGESVLPTERSLPGKKNKTQPRWFKCCLNHLLLGITLSPNECAHDKAGRAESSGCWLLYLLQSVRLKEYFNLMDFKQHYSKIDKRHTVLYE